MDFRIEAKGSYGNGTGYTVSLDVTAYKETVEVLLNPDDAEQLAARLVEMAELARSGRTEEAARRPTARPYGPIAVLEWLEDGPGGL
jgi:hypothetical protein